ncbi:hypothetical protein [Streptomyces sp. NPDC006552]|uniref:hypothetical protein n=1 Tax=Streptomyces sp. NPDC006552 TaxID=3157179 RepID=UPI0033A1378A
MEDDDAREDRLLRLALAGEPAATDDPGLAAVAADVAFLRDQVRRLGDTLAARPEPTPSRPVPVRPPAPARRRRPLRIAFAGLAAAGGLAVAGAMVWALAQSGGGLDSAADKPAAAGGGKVSPEGFVACSRLIAEGTVVAVERLPGTGQDRITLRVDRYLKPESGGARTLTFPVDHDARPRPKAGDRPLIAIPAGGGRPRTWVTGADRERLRATVLTALPGSRGVRCDRTPAPGG